MGAPGAGDWSLTPVAHWTTKQGMRKFSLMGPVPIMSWGQALVGPLGGRANERTVCRRRPGMDPAWGRTAA